jgi:hypothetical protein
MSEDNRRMRDQASVPIGLADTQLLGSNPKRIAVYIGAPLTNRFTLSFKGPAVLDQGITLYPLTAPFYLTFDHVGEAIHEPIQAISAVAPQNVNVLEIFKP